MTGDTDSSRLCSWVRDHLQSERTSDVNAKTGKLPSRQKRLQFTLRLGVKGSGRRIARGNADSSRLRIWMQDGGTQSHSPKWYSHSSSGKSCSSTSSTRRVPCGDWGTMTDGV